MFSYLALQVQILRSVSDWSIGQEVEQSILNGWIDAIEKAQHFIYIENQFFISSLGGSSIKNGIAKALLDRIVRAVHENVTFKVIVVVPLHPEGDFVHTR
jgi:phospholipase D1/2